ncbi:response regulator [Sediminibacterium goheungense]|uniref:Response regulator receiver domain-containing protein n=1 Tax=Sediminibacterium goheungense TaxID=1086393 RepID=A0A4R6J4B8_9BACT|nr:response regulator [Sediminibacterium goheungense]TDO29136.1 response regulator receiver domain-containing protein [Sediminibacterium goheungense]
MSAFQDLEILLVEDNEGDIRLTIEAFKEAKIRNQIKVVRDGEEALDYLKKQGRYTGVPSPDIILLDINLPKIDGKEVLGTMKKDPILKTIPVIMLTTSSAESDVQESYENHANCYVIKPVDLNKFMDVIRSIEDYWISIVKLPGKH